MAIKKIFAYTKEAKLPRKVIEQIAEAGYVPVPVGNYDCIRIIESVPDADNTLLIRTAFKAIASSKGYGSDDVREKFTEMLLNELTKRYDSEGE